MNKGPGAEEKFKEISAAYEVIFVPFVSVLSSGNFLSYILFALLCSIFLLCSFVRCSNLKVRVLRCIH